MIDQLVSISLLAIAFGEIEISRSLLVILICLTTFTFLAVGISSFKLIQSAVEIDDEKN